MIIRRSVHSCNIRLSHLLQASAASDNTAEIEELNRKLKSSDDELNALNRRFDEAQGKRCKVYKLHLSVLSTRMLNISQCLRSLGERDGEAQGRT
jgi:signal transduction protein with GAF and PtsI domain